MIRPVSKPRTVQFLNDFQVLKGACEKTMQNFGQPVSAAHEAQLMIRDDRQTLGAGEFALYAIHQRSENRIVKIIEATGEAKVTAMPVRTRVNAVPLPKAA